MISISVTIKKSQIVACKTLIFWSLLKARWNFYWHHQSSTAVMPFPKKKASVKFSARCFITSKAKTVLSLPSVLDKWYLSTFKCKKVRDCCISRSIVFLWFFLPHLTFCSLTKNQQSSIWSGPFSCKNRLFNESGWKLPPFSCFSSTWIEVDRNQFTWFFQGHTQNKIDCVYHKEGVPSSRLS